MADETFRPQKRPLASSQVNTPDEASSGVHNQLEQMAQMRKSIAESSDDESMPVSEEGGVQLQGRVPPQFQQALKKVRQETIQTEEEESDPLAHRQRQRSQQSRRQNLTNQPPEMRVTGSNRLEELLAGIQEKVGVYEIVRLPSRGRFYNGADGPTDGVLHVRRMTGEEEQILATPRFVRKGQAINMIFQKCIQERIDPDKLLTADRTYLLIFLRGISYTPDYDVEVKCSNCEAKFATVIDLNSLWLDMCPEDFDLDELTGTLPTTGYNYRYRLSRGADETQMQEYRERKMKGFDTAGQPDDTLLYRTAQLLEDVEGLTNKHELLALLKRLPISDVAHLRNLVNDPPFGVDTDIEIPCPSCTSEFTVDLPLEANFFFPRKKTITQTTTPA